MVGKTYSRRQRMVLDALQLERSADRPSRRRWWRRVQRVHRCLGAHLDGAHILVHHLLVDGHELKGIRPGGACKHKKLYRRVSSYNINAQNICYLQIIVARSL